VTDGGQIDVLVNNAGISMGGPIEELPLSEFRKAMETNISVYCGAFRPSFPVCVNSAAATSLTSRRLAAG
jgi:NAD(P)-dependent dehydrogenase (short-subunit alcohol dehydrogenase family)